MKKIISLLLVLCMFSFGACAFASEILPLYEVNAEDTYKISLKRTIRVGPEDTKDTRNYVVQQGSCTDGAYGYFVLENQKINQCCIVKVDLSDWSVVDIRYGLEIDHGNDLTYNSKTNQIVAVHYKPNYYNLSFIDPDTLEIVETKTVDVSMYSIGYCEERDQYVVGMGIGGGYDFAILDSELNVVEVFRGVDTGLVRQGADCDEKYIYFPQCASDNSVNQIVVYDWEGNYINTVKVVAFQEIESMFHVGDTTYIAFHAYGGYIYKAEMTKVDPQ